MLKFSALIILIYFISGCRGSEKDEKSLSGSPAVSYIDEKLLQEKITGRKGKVLFVNAWATWCAPCVEEFPDLVKIYNDYKDKDVEFLSLSVDFGHKADSLVQTFMISKDVPFPVYIVKESSSEPVINLLNTEWSGDVPATFIFSREGKLSKFIPGAQNYSQFKIDIDSVISL